MAFWCGAVNPFENNTQIYMQIPEVLVIGQLYKHKVLLVKMATVAHELIQYQS